MPVAAARFVDANLPLRSTATMVTMVEVGGGSSFDDGDGEAPVDDAMEVEESAAEEEVAAPRRRQADEPADGGAAALGSDGRFRRRR